jgi:TolB-like protein
MNSAQMTWNVFRESSRWLREPLQKTRVYGRGRVLGSYVQYLRKISSQDDTICSVFYDLYPIIVSILGKFREFTISQERKDKMKKLFFSILFAIFGLGIFAQQLPTVAVATFDVSGGVTKDDAQVVTELFITELVSKGTSNVVDRANFDKIIGEMKFQTSDWSNGQKTAQLGRALNADYLIRGQLMKMGNSIFWTATMIDVNTAQVLYSAREQLAALEQIWEKLPGFCSQIVAKIPMPNYFIGKWQASTKASIHTAQTILEFKDDGSVNVIKYQYHNYSEYWLTTGSGKGSYAFDNEKITIQVTINGGQFSTTTPYTFNDSRTSFALTRGLSSSTHRPESKPVSRYGDNEDNYFEFVRSQE